MEWFKEKASSIFIHYINIIFMFVVMDTCYDIGEFDYIYITLIYTALVLIYWFCTGVLNTKVKRFVFALILIPILGTVCFLMRSGIVQFFNSQIIDNIYDINDLLVAGQTTYFPQYKLIITLALSVIVFLLFFFYTNKMTELVLVLTLAEMIFFWYLEYYKEIKMLIFPFVLISLLTYIINNYKKTLFEFQKKGIYSALSHRNIVINIIIFSILAAAFGIPMPQEIEGNNNMSITERFQNNYNETSAESSQLETAYNSMYGLQYSGYGSTEKRLGGPIKLDLGLAFRVESDAAYYLKGDVKDKYTGNTWERSEEDLREMGDEGNLTIDKLKSSGFPEDLIDDNNLKQIKIYPEKLKSTSFMVPIYTYKIKDTKEKVFINDENSTFASPVRLTKPYTIEFYDVSYDGLSEENYSVYYSTDKKYTKFLQLPDTITERTVKLVYDLVKDCKNKEEKVKKIRDYLSKNYTYTLDAAYLPERQDFVDYFLFEDKKGYCVHFASALAVMYRIAGIPARFVEGYKMDSASKGTIHDVTNDMAHAWVEFLVADNLWSISDCAPTAQENIRREEKERQEQIDKDEEKDPNENKPNNENKKDDKASEKNNNTNVGKLLNKTSFIIFLGITGVVICVIVLVIVIKTRRTMLYGNSNIPLYNYIVKRLKRYKIQKGFNRTELEFIKSQEETLRSLLLPFVNKVYEEFYGGVIDGSIDKKEIYINFEKYIRSKESAFTYYFKRII